MGHGLPGKRYCNNGVALRFVAAGEPPAEDLIMRNVLIPLVALLTVACSARKPRSSRVSPPALSSRPRSLGVAASGAWRGLRQSRGRSLYHLRLHGRAHANPTYEQVSSGGTGHVEVVQVVEYDPAKVNYQHRC